MTDVIQTFWNRGFPLETIVDSYTYIGLKYSKSNYRLFNLSSLAFPDLAKIPEHVRTFIKDRPQVLGIANGVTKGGVFRVFSIVFRDLKLKDFCTYSVVSGIPYGVGDLKDFSFGDPLIVVEGLKDRDAFATIDPNVVALCGSSMGTVMREVLLTLTNNFILLYDNDETGHKQTRRDKFALEKRGCKVKIATHPEGHKDAGELIDLSFGTDFYTSEFLKSYYKAQMDVLKERHA